MPQKILEIMKQQGSIFLSIFVHIRIKRPGSQPRQEKGEIYRGNIYDIFLFVSVLLSFIDDQDLNSWKCHEQILWHVMVE